MTPPLTGGCACGAIRYTCTTAPVAMLNCHCTDCQRASGAPFASGVVVAAADLQTIGTPRRHAVQGASGGTTTRSFCADCSTPLFTQGEVVPQFVSIRFPTLDDQGGFRPMVDIWTSSAPPWVCFAPGIAQYEQSP